MSSSFFAVHYKECDREDEDRGADHAAVDLPAAVPKLPAPNRKADRDAVGAVRPGGRRSGNRSHHADLSGSRLGRRQDEALSSGTAPDAAYLYEAVMEGAVERVRPKIITVAAITAGLLPILWGTDTGSEVMSRIAAPMVGA